MFVSALYRLQTVLLYLLILNCILYEDILIPGQNSACIHLCGFPQRVLVFFPPPKKVPVDSWLLLVKMSVCVLSMMHVYSHQCSWDSTPEPCDSDQDQCSLMNEWMNEWAIFIFVIGETFVKLHGKVRNNENQRNTLTFKWTKRHSSKKGKARLKKNKHFQLFFRMKGTEANNNWKSWGVPTLQTETSKTTTMTNQSEGLPCNVVWTFHQNTM